MKKCPRCKIDKPYHDFYKCKSRKDRYDCYCKKCQKSSFKDYRKEYYKRYNQDPVKKKHKAEKEKIYSRKKYREDLKHNIRLKISIGINRSLKRGKNESCFKILGYSRNELIKSLKKTMPNGYKWEDFLSGKLHIDHIIPIAKFNFKATDDIEFHRCWALDNLQLLTRVDNLKKSDKCDNFQTGF